MGRTIEHLTEKLRRHTITKELRKISTTSATESPSINQIKELARSPSASKKFKTSTSIDKSFEAAGAVEITTTESNLPLPSQQMDAEVDRVSQKDSSFSISSSSLSDLTTSQSSLAASSSTSLISSAEASAIKMGTKTDKPKLAKQSTRDKLLRKLARSKHQDHGDNVTLSTSDSHDEVENNGDAIEKVERVTIITKETKETKDTKEKPRRTFRSATMGKLESIKQHYEEKKKRRKSISPTSSLRMLQEIETTESSKSEAVQEESNSAFETISPTDLQQEEMFFIMFEFVSLVFFVLLTMLVILLLVLRVKESTEFGAIISYMQEMISFCFGYWLQ